MPIPIIDLFAGPGGLGEGFTSVLDENNERVFNIKLSIEKDPYAHQTLRLRSFYRQFPIDQVPELYYDFIKENDSKRQRQLLKSLKKEFKEQWENAEYEAWLFELPFIEETKKKTIIDSEGNSQIVEYKIGYGKKEIVDAHTIIDRRIEHALDDSRNFLLIGGPPCQAYSLVGRARNQGISEQDHRVHLYKEYLRIIAKHQPAVFVMENVKGLLSAKINETKVFELIKKDLNDPNRVFPELKSSKYKIFSFVKEPDDYDENGFPVYKDDKDFLIKTEKYRIPQRRHRVILLGIREDLKHSPIMTLRKEEIETTLHQVISGLPQLRSGIGREIIATNEKGNHIYKTLTNDFATWSKTINKYLKSLDVELRSQFHSLIKDDSQGRNYLNTVLVEKENPLYKSWYKDEKLQGVLNHESRTHLKEDLGRYLFSALYLKAKGEFPRLKDYPEELQPAHKNRKSGKFADRFRTQKPDQAATTVTSHISKDGHYFIHYDPSQCRSLTVREAARIQTFPDNYNFCGSRTHQYHQVGNAVPPYLAKQLAEIVRNIL